MTDLWLPDRLAARPFTAAQAADVGVPDRSLRRLVAAGAVVSPLDGVYRAEALPETLDVRAQACALVLPPGAALCRGTAAWLYGVDTRRPGEHHRPPALECVVPLGRVPLRYRDGGLVSYQAPMPASDVVVVGSVPTTTPLRTACDLLRLRPGFIALAAADALARLNLIDVDELPDAIERWRGHRGMTTARMLARIVDAGAASPGESWMRLRFADAGLPRPQLQIPVGGSPGSPRYLLDSGWPGRLVAAEYDGEEFHQDVEQDQLRRKILRDEFGWETVVARKGDVLGTSMLLEQHVGALLGVEVRLTRRRW